MQLDAAGMMTGALKGTHVNKVNAEEIEDSDDDTTGHGAVPPRPTWNFRRTSFLWRAQRKRAAMAMSPSIC